MTRTHFSFAIFLAILLAAVIAGLLPHEAAALGAVFGITFTEDIRVGDWLKWEEDQRWSRDAITLASGQNLKSGTVLGRTLSGAAAAATAFAGNTGNGVMGAIVVGGDAKLGTYKLIFIEPGTNLGTFDVEDPDGKLMGRGVVGTAFNVGGLTFTLADGATDFISGDGFDIKVTGGVYKYAIHDPAATDGTERAAGILVFDCDATSADTNAVAITRQAIVGSGYLTWKAGMTAQQKTDALATLQAAGIVARTSA